MKPSPRLLLLTIGLLLALALPGCLPPKPPITPTTRPNLTPSLTAPVTSAPPDTPAPPSPPSDLPKPEFAFRFGRLSLQTSLLYLELKDGSLVLLRDQASGEMLLETDSAGQCDFDFPLSGGFTSRDALGSLIRNCPPYFHSVDFAQIDDYHGQLTYRGLSSAPDSSLTLDVKVDTRTGEVLLQLIGYEAQPDRAPIALNLALMELNTPAVILGSGVQVRRGDPPIETQSAEVGYGLYGISMAVIEGEQASAAVWSESTQFAPELIRLVHAPKQDHLILHSEADPKETTPGQIVSPPWRIGTYPGWPQAARRWREEFERRTGARPLWENQSAWVRQIHAVFDSTNQYYGDNAQKYADLAAAASPQCVLFYLWNGDRLVLFGDPTLAAQIGRPDPELLQNIEKHGWPLLLYHPFNLIYTEKGADGRLKYLAAQGWLPENYQFTPDYPGAPADWYAYWASARGNYDNTLSILHPGAPEFHRYLIQNFGNYAQRYGAEAAYMDVLGNNGLSFFSSVQQIINGQDYVSGEVNALTALRQEHPELAIMNEYQSPWLIPYTFYTWEGVETHLRQAKVANMNVNHPLRAALFGSYQWARETNGEQADDLLAALLGTLPQISLTGDYEVSDARARWSQQRAQLFCGEELFNDLPAQWDAEALAYYRSQRTGHWFKFVRLGDSYGYVEELPDGSEQVRLKR